MGDDPSLRLNPVDGSLTQDYRYEILSVETIDGDTAPDGRRHRGGIASHHAPTHHFAQLQCPADDALCGVPTSAFCSNCGSLVTCLVATTAVQHHEPSIGPSPLMENLCHEVASPNAQSNSKQSNLSSSSCFTSNVDTSNVTDQSSTNVAPPTYDLCVNVRIKKKPIISSDISPVKARCLPFKLNMFSFLSRNNQVHTALSYKQIIFPIILIISVFALVLLHNGSLRTRKASAPTKFFKLNPFITDFEHGEIKELWARLVQNEVAFIIYYAPWDAECIRARTEIEVVANHYGQQIFFSAINCWWPDGECRKYHNIRRYPHLVAHVRSEGEIDYKGPLLASYIIPFLDNVMNPVIPIQNEGELLDLRAKHDAVVLGYFDFNQSPHQPGYRSYLATSFKALTTDPWRSVAYTVVTNSRTASKLKIDPSKHSSLLLYLGNTTEHFTAKSSKPTTILSWIYSRSQLFSTVKWINPSGIKSNQISAYVHKKPTFILFTPRSFLLGISPYFDLLRELVLEYNNCDNSPIIRSLIHRNILRRRLLEEKLSELEERCHELLDEVEASKEERVRRFSDHEDTCCHSQTVQWRSFGGARRGMTKQCLCTACVHISLPKCPARCQHFDCLSTAARYLDDFDPNYVNNSAVYCNQVKAVYEPKYTSYYKIYTTCSGNLQPSYPGGNEDTGTWYDVNKYTLLTTDEKISRMIQDFEIQHCRRLKLGMNYTDLNFPDSNESGKSSWRANFTGLACRTNRTLKFMSLDSLLYPAFAESLGIDVFNVPHSTIAVIIDPSKESIHVLDHDIVFEEVKMQSHDSNSVLNVPTNSYSKRTFIEFIKNFTDGTLPRFLRSQLVSSSGLCDLKQMVMERDSGQSNVICVPELNSITFNDFVLGKSVNQTSMLDKDVLVMYYAPWCGFCTSIAHVYLDVARFFAFSKNIIFTRINGDATDLPWEYTVDRYPTIMFFPAKKRSNSVAYSPNQPITQSGLFDFILNHAQLSVKIQIMLTFCKSSCLERSLIGNHYYRRAISRSIRHFLNTLSLFQHRKQEISHKLSQASSKEWNKLKMKQDRVERHLEHCRASLRQLRRAQRRHSLLSNFLLQRIDALRQLDSTQGVGKLSHELYRLLYQKSIRDKRVKEKAKVTPDSSRPVDRARPSKAKLKTVKDEL